MAKLSTRTAAVVGDIVDTAILWMDDAASNTSWKVAWSTLKSKLFNASLLRIQDSSDPTKQIAFDASGVGTGQTRNIIMPNNDVDLSGLKKNNFTATTNPGVSDDNTAGYSIGSLVFNTVLGLLWRCYDASTGAAVWRSADDKRATTRTVSGTTDTILESDSGGLVVYTNGAAIAVTLPDTFGVDFHFTVVQAGAGVPTVTRSGTDTINGAATGVSPSARWKGMYLAQYSAGTYLALK